MLLSARNQNVVVEAGTLAGSQGQDAPGERFGPANDRGVNRNKFQMRLALRVALLVSEIAAIVLTFGLAAYIRFGTAGLGQLATVMSVTLPVYIGTALNSRAFDLAAIRDFGVSAKRALLAFSFTIGTVMLMVFFLKASADFSRLVFGMGTAMCLPVLLALRLLFVKLTRRIMGANPFSELIICDGVTLENNYDAMMIDAAAYGLEPSTRDPHNIQRLGGFVRNIDRVIVACPPERRNQWAFVLKALDIDAELCVPELDELGAVSMCRLGETSTMVVSAGPLALRHRMVKRGFDLAFVLAVLPVLAIPMALVALAIKLETPGPVLFRQVRIGRGNRPFHILKFRSMRVDMCDANGNRSAGRDDDRITRVGRFIRKTSIDELPQILNVLKGDMSLVGPRPFLPAQKEIYDAAGGRAYYRMRPGVTGLWQVMSRHDTTFPTRVRFDEAYGSNLHALGDLGLILRTAKVVLTRTGA